MGTPARPSLAPSSTRASRLTPLPPPRTWAPPPGLVSTATPLPPRVFGPRRLSPPRPPALLPSPPPLVPSPSPRPSEQEFRGTPYRVAYSCIRGLIKYSSQFVFKTETKP